MGVGERRERERTRTNENENERERITSNPKLRKAMVVSSILIIIFCF